MIPVVIACEMITQIFRVIANGQEIVLASPPEVRDDKLERLDKIEAAGFAIFDPLLTLIIAAAKKTKADIEAKDKKEAGK